MIRLTLDDQGDGHADLLLNFNGVKKRGDSYYLRLDHAHAPGDHSTAKAARVLTQLLNSWTTRLQAPPQTSSGWKFWQHADKPLEETPPVFLPCLFDDETTRWLRCRGNEEELLVDVGWSSFEGHGLLPSKPDSWPSELPDFEPLEDFGALRISREAFLQQLADNLGALTGPLPPSTDPTPLFEYFRGSYGTELLTAAVAHFDLPAKLRQGARTFDQLRTELGLEERPAVVLFTALRAMGVIDTDPDGRLRLSRMAREHLVANTAFDVSGYIGLAAGSPSVLEMVKRLKTNRPAGLDDKGSGTAFIYRAGVASAMEQSELARHFTLSLAGRAKNVAPALAERVDLSSAHTLLDLGGGSGLYAIAFLRRFPQLRAIVFDRPEVLRVAEEYRETSGVADRLTLLPGDMFTDSLPEADVVLLSNILHDWDVPECQELITRATAALPSNGRLLIHDVFLNDALDGPLPIALYSAALFSLTEGRVYSRAEYASWLTNAGLDVTGPEPTFIHCGVLTGRKSSI